MGYQSVNLQSDYFSDLNASIPYPVWPQVELPETLLFLYFSESFMICLSLSWLLFKQDVFMQKFEFSLISYQP